ncbi:sialate O-acetylesterase [uncultured Bacteroides sp.]|jgi:hypothetical protein|uniref:sialate O-acetylesterase n=1 Tax=uncultured Bacteroides sp. TaxID=162156 RepID=UPI00280C0771|nr:sialate O-acetylesterase [uncultured Bacteroides sp.]
MKYLLASFLLLFVLHNAQVLQAKITLPSIYSDGMVLQRNKPIKIWGEASHGEEFALSFANKTYQIQADGNGRWSALLPKLKEGGPYELDIVGKENRIRIQDILIGDVWFCSGQSNMQWVVNNVTNAEAEKQKADYPQIRTLNMPRRMSLAPLDTVSAQWEVCSPQTVGKCSGVAYFFAKKVYEETHIPIGIINSSWGGTVVETWTSIEAASTLSPEMFKRFTKEKSTLIPPMEFFEEKKKVPVRNDYPSLVYNAMVNPLLSLAIKGVVWYQGEDNVGKAEHYSDWLACMISDWRLRWDTNLPFYIVQLPNFDSLNKQPLWAEMREEQCEVLAIDNTHLIVTTDLGDPRDLHPRNKQEVGVRVALQVLNHEYGRKDIVSESPMFHSMKIEGNKAVVTFKHIGSGLEIRSRYGCLQGFAIAGADKIFHWANAKLEKDNKVIVWSKKVQKPLFVRYNWENNPDGNLYNKDGLPACSFRTDH